MSLIQLSSLLLVLLVPAHSLKVFGGYTLSTCTTIEGRWVTDVACGRMFCHMTGRRWVPSPGQRSERKIFKWGQWWLSDSWYIHIKIAESICREQGLHAVCECTQYLVVSNTYDNSQEHYEILGSEQVFSNLDLSYIVGSLITYGKQTAGPSELRIQVFHGECRRPHAWSYCDLFFIVKSVTRPPITYAFSYEVKHSAYPRDSRFRSTKVVHPRTANPSKAGHRIVIGKFRCDLWKKNCLIQTKLWLAQTRVIDQHVRYDDKVILAETTRTLIRPIILENHGYGTTRRGDFLSISSSETVTVTSTARFTSTFDFSIETSAEAGFDILGNSVKVGITIHFGFSYSKDLSKEVSKSTTTTITSPSSCPAGYRRTFHVIEHSDNQRIPVEFTLEREGIQWSETKNVELAISSKKIHSDDCCLYVYADTTNCDTTHLPMCD
ncbi:uncharacterized protein [Amphiura filiformis]|uniref:uncharacterized protein n=1 Tax=Amphiura filiformis TaxID=82378 RepID=UPI003B22137E